MSDLPGVFITTPEFLPQRAQRERTLQLTAAEARGQQRLAEANRTVLTTSTPSSPHSKPTSRNLPKIRPDNSIHPATAAQKRHENTRIKAIAAPHDLDQAGGTDQLRRRRRTRRRDRYWRTVADHRRHGLIPLLSHAQLPHPGSVKDQPKQLSGITRNRNVRHQPTSYMAVRGAGGARTRDQRIMSPYPAFALDLSKRRVRTGSEPVDSTSPQFIFYIGPSTVMIRKYYITLLVVCGGIA